MPAKMATTLTLSVKGALPAGAGWFELEHTTYGLPFSVANGCRLDEALTIITRLWTEDRVTFAGRYYQLTDAFLNPRPVQQPRPSLLVGASGEQIALDIVARHADIWNSFGSPEVFARKIAVLTEHCRKAGRDPETIEKSVLLQMTLTMIQRPARRARENEGWGILAGSPAEIRQQIDRYIAVGVTSIIISLSAPYNYEAVHRFAAEVMPAFR
jgi:alkanesulfonate monooxygenase SsuD/methylene tetrahydromethanopterin reductase-like flavin-dependent oxidoreductase (luciferase family)